MKKVLFKIAYFLFEIAVGIMVNVIFGKENRKELETLIKDLDWDNELTAKQKYNRAKKFLDGVIDDVPDIAKNIAIEAAVAKVTKSSGDLLKKFATPK